MSDTNTLSIEKWAKRITAAWQKQVPSILETGTLLESAKAELKHGDWIAMVESKLPFNRYTAAKLLKISCYQPFRDVSPGKHLPANWTILYELTNLTEQQFERAIAEDEIHPKMQRKDVRALRGEPVVERSKGRVRKIRTLVTHLNSLAWSEANVQLRQKFINAVGLKEIWETMTVEMREALMEIVLAEVKDGRFRKAGASASAN